MRFIRCFFGLLLMVSISGVFGQGVYKDRAQALYGNIYRTYYDSKSGLFTETNNKDADEKPHSYLWPLCALVQAANEMEVLQPDKKYMGPVMKAIDQYYSLKEGITGYDSYVVKQGGGDRFYDDNQWIGLAYIDAYDRTKKKVFLRKAEEIYRFMMSGFDTVTGGGLYWKEGDKSTKNTCSNGPGVLLALKLYKTTKEQRYLDTALVLYDWTNRRLQAPAGTYYDNIKTKDNRIEKRLYTYNTGTMLQSNVILYTITGEKRYLQEAQRQAAASLEEFYHNGRLPGNYWFNAVLMRGYKDLYALDKNKIYLQAFITDADGIAKTEVDEQGLAGPHPAKKLLDQAGLLEICARIAHLQQQGF